METYIQRARRNKDREIRKVGGSNRPYIGHIFSVNSQTESVNVEFYAGVKSGTGIKVLHPFLSISSWHRVMPDNGSGVLLHNRADTNDPEIERYYQPNPQNRIEAYANATEAYRPLQPGEQEISSSGLAQIFFSRRPAMDIRGGIVRQWLDQDKTEYGVRAPIHRKLGYQNASDIISDEQRFGVVKRSTSSVYEQYSKVEGNFAKENIDVLNFEGTPSTLYDKREGHVVDNAGNQIVSNYTGNNLRLRHIYYTINEEALVKEIDELGNVAITLPNSDAEDGMTLLIPNGNMQVQVGKTYSEVVSGNKVVNIAGDHTSIVESKEVLQVDGEVDHNYAGNIKTSITENSYTMEDSAGNKITMDKTNIKIDSSKKVYIKGSTGITIEDSNVILTGGSVTINSKVPVTPTLGLGPFCALPTCLFTGAPHTGIKADQT